MSTSDLGAAAHVAAVNPMHSVITVVDGDTVDTIDWRIGQRVHPRFKMRPFSRKVRQVLKKYLDSLSQIRDDPELRGRIVEGVIGADPHPMEPPIEWRTHTPWDRRAAQVEQRLNELLDMNAIDLMNLLVRA